MKGSLQGSIQTSRVPHGGVRPFNRKSTCLTQSTCGPSAVQIWSHNPQNVEATRHSNSTVGGVHQLRRNVKRFRGGLVFKAHRLLYHSTLGLRIIKKRRRGCTSRAGGEDGEVSALQHRNLPSLSDSRFRLLRRGTCPPQPASQTLPSTLTED